jgi:hypothetical protein
MLYIVRKGNASGQAGVGCDPNMATVLLCCSGTQSRAGLISALGKESKP